MLVDDGNIIKHFSLFKFTFVFLKTQIFIATAYPSSHPVIKDIRNPYEINEYFDSIETSKATAVLRMIEGELTKEKFLSSLIVTLLLLY